MTRRWYFAPLLALAAVAALAAAGCGSAASPSGSTGSTRPAAPSTPTSGSSTQPAGDPFLGISKLCLITWPQLQSLSPTIAGLGSKPTDQPVNGVDTCQYGGKVTASGLLTKFLSVTVLPTWSGESSHFVSQTAGFGNASAGEVTLNGTSLVTAGAQITSGSQQGQYLVLTVGSTKTPLVTVDALKATLALAEKQYAASNAGPSSAPSAPTGGNGSGRFPCNLLSVSTFNSFGPNGMTGNVSGSGKAPNFDASTTVQVCGYVFYTGPNDSGTEKGYVALTLSCGPNAKLATDADDMQRVFSMPNGTTAAVALTFGINSRHYVNTPQALDALSAAANAAKAGGRCT